MTISASSSEVVLGGNGATTVFDFSFIAGAVSNIVVTYTNATGVSTVLALGTQYTVFVNAPTTGSLWGVGGSITYPLTGSPIAAGTYLTIQRILPLTQVTSISNQGDFYPQAVERALDTLCMEIQQIAALVSGAVQYNIADVGPFETLPPVALRANQLLGFDSSGNPIAAEPSSALVSSAMQPVVAAASIAAANALLGIQTEYVPVGTGSSPRSFQVKIAETLVSVKDYGATGNGTTDDTTSCQEAIAAVALAGGDTVYFPPGIYEINPTGLSVVSGVSLIGAGIGVTTLRGTAATFTRGLINGVNAVNFTISGFTFDFSAVTPGFTGVVSFVLCGQYWVERCNFIGNFQFGIAHNAGNNFTFRDNIIVKTTAAGTQNQGIVVSTFSGPCLYGLIDNNTLVNTAMDVSAQYLTVSNNRVSNWMFGSGITTEIDSECSDIFIIGNTCVRGTGTDVNSTNCCGIESWAPRAVISNNILGGNAGDGIDVGGQYSIVTGNVCFNNGQVYGSGIIIRYSNGVNNGNYSTVTGNVCFDEQPTRTQAYGYNEESSSVFGVTVSGNTFTQNLTGEINTPGIRTSVETPTYGVQDSYGGFTLANGSSIGGTFGVSAAAMGDIISIGSSVSLQGLTLNGWVPSVGSVSFLFINSTGVPVTVGAMTLTISVRKPVNYASY